MIPRRNSPSILFTLATIGIVALLLFHLQPNRSVKAQDPEEAYEEEVLKGKDQLRRRGRRLAGVHGKKQDGLAAVSRHGPANTPSVWRTWVSAYIVIDHEGIVQYMSVGTSWMRSAALHDAIRKQVKIVAKSVEAR